MNVTKKWGMIFLAAWLILSGLNLFLKLSFEGMPYVLGGLALAAGIFILIDR